MSVPAQLLEEIFFFNQNTKFFCHLIFLVKKKRQTAKAKVAQIIVAKGRGVFVWCCREGRTAGKAGWRARWTPVYWHLSSSEVLWLDLDSSYWEVDVPDSHIPATGRSFTVMGCLNHCSVLQGSLGDQEFLGSQGLLVKLRFYLKPIWFSDMLGMFLKCMSVPWSGMLSEFTLLSFGDWDIYPGVRSSW